MHAIATAAVAAAAALLAITPACAVSWQDHQTAELEHLLVDTSGFNDAGFARGVTPCSFYVSGAQNTGRTSAGQWMRVAFHDFATFDAAAGTGGIDASIGWETMREENKGAAMNDSMGYWAGFVNKYTTMADMIALGTVVATASCNGPKMAFKGGRVDALQGGDFGVPEPFGTLHEHLDRADIFGFDQTEFIQLTACGHTVGSTHHAGFPDVVPESAVSPTNTQGGVAFDDTKFAFDNHVATTYLDGTTTNPFVTSFNETNRSDLRLFSSDGNATMAALASSNTYFLDVCNTVYTKMINSVPSSVTLRDIVPQAVKPVGVQVRVNAAGVVTFTGTIRLLSTTFPAGVSRTVAVSYIGTDNVVHAITASPSSTGASVVLGATTAYYAFTAPVSAAGVSSFVVQITQGGRTVVYDNAGARFPVVDGVQWLPLLSSASVDATHGVLSVKFSAAVRTSLRAKSVSAVFSIPTPQIGTMTPKIVEQTVPLTKGLALGASGYTLYSFAQNVSVPGGINVTSRAVTLAARSTTFDVVAALADGRTVTDEFRKVAEVGVSGVDTSIWW